LFVIIIFGFILTVEDVMVGAQVGLNEGVINGGTVGFGDGG
jgi:hypothetical protein